MNLNDKAYYEYGRARGWLKANRRDIRSKISPTEDATAWHFERMIAGLEGVIQDAWNKRKLCRRICGMCVYCIAKPKSDQRRMCQNYGDYVYYETSCINCKWFTPRKETN